jgi:uncharacterized protein YndB with AHSA1/START domain
MHGSYDTIDGHPALRFERRLGHPVDAVWRAITEPAELERWFPSQVEGDLQCVGGQITFIFREQPLKDAPVTIAGHVTHLDPPNLFAFYWGEDHLRFELEPVESGACTDLRFTVLLDAQNKAARDAAGWHQCLDGLARTLDGGHVGRPYVPDQWRVIYDEYSRRGMPTGAEIPS